MEGMYRFSLELDFQLGKTIDTGHRGNQSPGVPELGKSLQLIDGFVRRKLTCPRPLKALMRDLQHQFTVR